MSETAETKHERVHLRLDARSKRKLERAAAYEETTVSRFVLHSSVAAAERVIEAREQIVLLATDWDAFHDALLNPPARSSTPSHATAPIAPSSSPHFSPAHGCGRGSAYIRRVEHGIAVLGCSTYCQVRLRALTRVRLANAAISAPSLATW